MDLKKHEPGEAHARIDDDRNKAPRRGARKGPLDFVGTGDYHRSGEGLARLGRELMDGTVTDNAARRRFELEEQGEIAFATYRRDGDVVTIPHVEAPEALRGKGSAGRLMEGVVALARGQGFKIAPRCPYAAAWFRRHPEAADVLAQARAV
jgi:predicted GNAT family acetyltransferase